MEKLMRLIRPHYTKSWRNDTEDVLGLNLKQGWTEPELTGFECSEVSGSRENKETQDAPGFHPELLVQVHV